MTVIRNFMDAKQSKDLYALLSPPKAHRLSWKAPPDPNWMCKVSTICYDFAEIAPNSKLAGKKVREAIAFLMERDEIKNSTQKNDQGFRDLCDLTIRVAMAKFRDIKKEINKRDLLLRRMDKEDQCRIKLVLDRILLPKEYVESSEEEGDMSLRCKVEFYDKKSYIREYKDGKFKQIIGSCSDDHREVCEQLVPMVQRGMEKEELLKERAQIMEELSKNVD
eukprot:s1962_g10.t1